MSELSVRQYLHNDGSGLTWGYDKREADAVIAELEESHKKEVEQLLIEIAELKKRVAELETLNHDLCERVTENDEIRLHWEEIEQTRAENERMKARIAELEDERRWRKFPDEKPEEWDTVVVRFSNGFYDLAVYLSNGQGWDIGDGLYHKSEEVSHWMPLPAAPKEKNA